MRTAISLAIFVVHVAGIAAAAPPPAAGSGYEADVLDVKFKEGTKVRLRGGVPADVASQDAVRSDIQGIVHAFAAGTWARTHSIDETTLDRLRTAGQAHRAKPLPDLNNYFRLSLPPGVSATTAKAMLERFSSVEAAYLVPTPVQPPTAPDYSGPPQPVYQDYLNAAPAGIDARNAWSRGWTGAGVRVCDVEYWMNRAHVDLPSIGFLGNFAIDPFGDDHGTSVMGEMAAKNDGAGTKGIAYGAKYFYAGAYTNLGYSVPRGLMECGAALSAGDVVLLEQQMVGPNGGGYYVPPEWSKPVYDAIVTLVANGIVVVETSGNGSEDLDEPIFSTGNDGHWPFLLENDSGAIIVTGAQSPHAPFPRDSWYWSNGGATVDLQAWGDSIVTTGSGNLYSSEGRNVFYRSDFSGSSGAAPMVAGAVALLEQASKSLYGTPLPPATVKQVLVSTGTPQAPGPVNLGPLPNLNAALNAIAQTYYVDSSAGGLHNGTSWANAYFQLQDALRVAGPGSKILVAEGTYWPDWDPTIQTFTNSRSATFQLKSGVTILGGFPSGGGTRDPNLHATFLSGDAGAQYNDIDNCYHVVSAGSTIDESAVLDGFRVQVGRGDGGYPNDRGGALYISGGSPTLRNDTFQYNKASIAAGVYTENGAPVFQNVTIAYNNALTGGGGGMWNQGGSPRLTQVTFQQNVAPGEGGGLFTQGGTPLIEETSFLDNTGQRGGGMSHWPGGNTVLDSVLFRGNQASADIGGAILNWQGILRLNNVTLDGNTTPFDGGGIYVFDPNTVTIRNSIIWGNYPGNVSGATAMVSHSIIQGGYPGTAVSSLDPWYRALYTDERLSPGSAAIDAGDPATCAATDVRGVLRDDQCDMGAYEYRGNAGTYWSNGEVDLITGGESYDATATGGAKKLSADDFIIDFGYVCDVSAVRGVLQDGTKFADASFTLYDSYYQGPPVNVMAQRHVQAFCAHDPSMACGDMADCVTGSTCDSTCFNSGYQCENNQCVSPCILPGESLGTRGGQRLWEPHFDNLGWRLGPGTYWVAMYGTVEPGSAGVSYSMSAGDGTIYGSPYAYSEDSVNWVDGGTHYGGASRAVALEVDAVCGEDDDGDLSPVGEDCDDTNPFVNPSAIEVCNGIDDNCDGIADPGVPPSTTPTLYMTRTQLSWTPVAGGTTVYDIESGNFQTLRDTGGDFSTGYCEASGLAQTGYDLGDGQPKGLGIWYLVRAHNVCGAGTYNDLSNSQSQDRDGEIANQSGAACP